MKRITHLLASGLLVMSFCTTADASFKKTQNQKLHLNLFQPKTPVIFEEEIVESAVKYIIIEKLGVESFMVTWEANFVHDLGADELDVIELFMAIEDEFMFEIPDADAENISTVGALIEYVRIHYYS